MLQTGIPLHCILLPWSFFLIRPCVNRDRFLLELDLSQQHLVNERDFVVRGRMLARPGQGTRPGGRKGLRGLTG